MNVPSVKKGKMIVLKDYGEELFKGTAWYYSRYRPVYPSTLIRFLVDKFQLDGEGRLLDLGCGSGQMALRFTDWFEHIIGVDTEPEMLEEAERLTTEYRADNMQWIQARAEDITPAWGGFRVATIAKAFHWMDRDKVLDQLHANLSNKGGIAIIDHYNPDYEPQAWQLKVNEIVRHWLGNERRAGNSTYTPPQEKYEDILSRSKFIRVESHRLPTYNYDWTIDSIIGNLYSTSFASKRLLGDKVEYFENDLRQALYDISSTGVLKEEMSLSVNLAFKGE